MARTSGEFGYTDEEREFRAKFEKVFTAVMAKFNKAIGCDRFIDPSHPLHLGLRVDNPTTIGRARTLYDNTEPTSLIFDSLSPYEQRNVVLGFIREDVLAQRARQGMQYEMLAYHIANAVVAIVSGVEDGLEYKIKKLLMFSIKHDSSNYADLPGDPVSAIDEALPGDGLKDDEFDMYQEIWAALNTKDLDQFEFEDRAKRAILEEPDIQQYINPFLYKILEALLMVKFGNDTCDEQDKNIAEKNAYRDVELALAPFGLNAEEIELIINNIFARFLRN